MAVLVDDVGYFFGEQLRVVDEVAKPAAFGENPACRAARDEALFAQNADNIGQGGVLILEFQRFVVAFGVRHSGTVYVNISRLRHDSRLRNGLHTANLLHAVRNEPVGIDGDAVGSLLLDFIPQLGELR